VVTVPVFVKVAAEPLPTVIVPVPVMVTVPAFESDAPFATVSAPLPLMVTVAAAATVSEPETVIKPVALIDLLRVTPDVFWTLTVSNARTLVPVPLIDRAAAGLGVANVIVLPVVTSGVATVVSWT